MPEVPTIAEVSFPTYPAMMWQAFDAPAGCRPAIARRLNEETKAALEEPAPKKLHLAQGVEPEASSPDELAKRISNDIEKWRTVIRGASISSAK